MHWSLVPQHFAVPFLRREQKTLSGSAWSPWGSFALRHLRLYLHVDSGEVVLLCTGQELQLCTASSYNVNIGWIFVAKCISLNLPITVHRNHSIVPRSDTHFELTIPIRLSMVAMRTALNLDLDSGGDVHVRFSSQNCSSYTASLESITVQRL